MVVIVDAQEDCLVQGPAWLNAEASAGGDGEAH